MNYINLHCLCYLGTSAAVMPESGRKMGWFGTARKVVVAVGGVLFMLSNAAHGYTKPEDGALLV